MSTSHTVKDTDKDGVHVHTEETESHKDFKHCKTVVTDTDSKGAHFHEEVVEEEDRKNNKGERCVVFDRDVCGKHHHVEIKTTHRPTEDGTGVATTTVCDEVDADGKKTHDETTKITTIIGPAAGEAKRHKVVTDKDVNGAHVHSEVVDNDKDGHHVHAERTVVDRDLQSGHFHKEDTKISGEEGTPDTRVVITEKDAPNGMHVYKESVDKELAPGCVSHTDKTVITKELQNGSITKEVVNKTIPAEIDGERVEVAVHTERVEEHLTFVSESG